MKPLRSRLLLICVAVALLLAILSGTLLILGKSGYLGTVTKTVAKPFMWVGTFFADAMNGFVDTFVGYDRLKEENLALKDALDSVEDNASELEQLREENQWLKDYLALADRHPELQMTDARVIGREGDNTSLVLTLNRGSVHGVKVNMPVITADGLFGYVSEAGLDWCRVVSILDPSSSAGAYTDRGVQGVVEGDVVLRKDGVCLMRYIETDADLQIGDRVYTAGGAGSIYPSGLLIGEVISIDADESTRTLTAGIAPAARFSDSESPEGMMILLGYRTEG